MAHVSIMPLVIAIVIPFYAFAESYERGVHQLKYFMSFFFCIGLMTIKSFMIYH